MSWMRHNMTLVTHSMWSFWGWVEQSTLKCIDLCFFIIIIVIIIIFNGGNPPVTNPHHYHYCQNPTMVGFWLVGICWLAITMTMTKMDWQMRRRTFLSLSPSNLLSLIAISSISVLIFISIAIFLLFFSPNFEMIFRLWVFFHLFVLDWFDHVPSFLSCSSWSSFWQFEKATKKWSSQFGQCQHWKEGALTDYLRIIGLLRICDKIY